MVKSRQMILDEFGMKYRERLRNLIFVDDFIVFKCLEHCSEVVRNNFVTEQCKFFLSRF